MKTKLTIAIIIVILVLPLLVAQTYKQNTAINISVPCKFNSTECSGSATCNVTVFDNEEVKILRNETLTVDANSFFVVQLNTSQTANFGIYRIDFFCSDQGIGDAPSINFEVTPTGEQLSTSQGIIHLGMLLAGFVVFGLCMWGTIVIPFRNQRDEEGSILSVNALKPVKVVLGFFAYLSLLFIATIVHDISKSYLFLNATQGLFNIVHIVLLIMVYPLALLTLIVAVKIFWVDTSIQKLINQGIIVQ